MNICSGVETRVDELTQILHQLAQTPVDIKIIPSHQKQGERFVGSREKAQAVLGWAPKIQLYEGLERLGQAVERTVSISSISRKI
jgi:nucleoside-diphosphate-sugar epimerase